MMTLISDNDLWAQASYGEPVFEFDNHNFIINHGVKVMRDKTSGKLTFKNTRTGSDFYGKVYFFQELWLREYGFEIGARLITIHTLLGWVEAANRIVQDTTNENALIKYKSRRLTLLKDIRNNNEKINSIGRRKLGDEAFAEVQQVVASLLNHEYDSVDDPSDEWAG